MTTIFDSSLVKEITIFGGKAAQVLYEREGDDQTPDGAMNLYVKWKEDPSSTVSYYLEAMKLGGATFNPPRLNPDMYRIVAKDDVTKRMYIELPPKSTYNNGWPKFYQFATLATGALGLQDVIMLHVLNGCVQHEYSRRYGMRASIFDPSQQFMQPLCFTFQNAGPNLYDVTIIDGEGPFEYSGDGTIFTSSSQVTTTDKIYVRDTNGFIAERSIT